MGVPIGELRCDDEEIWRKAGDDHHFGVTGFHVYWIPEDQVFWIVADDYTPINDDERVHRQSEDRVAHLPGFDGILSVAKLSGLSPGGYAETTVHLQDLETEGYFARHVVRLGGVPQVCPADLLEASTKEEEGSGNQ